MGEQEHIASMIGFLESIGIPVREGEVPDTAFLPGILVERGALVIDRDKLAYPGDLLHEAAHIAVTAGDRRSAIGGALENDPGEELAAICWSYAAARHLGLESRWVFHAHGYRGEGDWLASQFDAGTYVGLPLLEWMGLTVAPERAGELGVAPFPHMLRWLRDSSDR